MDDTMKDVVLESKLNSSRRPSLDTLNEPTLLLHSALASHGLLSQ